MPLSQLCVVLKNLMASGCLSRTRSSRRSKDGVKAWAGLSRALKQRCLLSATAVLVEDIQPGGGLNNGTESSAPGAAVDVSGTTYFVANDGINGAELWRISAGGTAQLVEDSIPGGGIRPGAVGANSSQLTNVSGVFYFSVDDGAHGQEL
jgi:ELWxxDGT repeat protein